MKASIYNQKGSESGSADLPDGLFDVAMNADLVHQVVTVAQANARNPIAHAKDRSEKRGGGKKPWQQKGTGRARHGSIRSPIWAGGGATHAPLRSRKHGKKVNKKMRQKALACVLSGKAQDDEVVLVDELDFEESKTALGKEFLDALSDSLDDNILDTSATIVVKDITDELKRVFSNFNNIDLVNARNLTALQPLENKYLVLVEPDEITNQLSERLGSVTQAG